AFTNQAFIGVLYGIFKARNGIEAHPYNAPEEKRKVQWGLRKVPYHVSAPLLKILEKHAFFDSSNRNIAIATNTLTGTIQHYDNVEYTNLCNAIAFVNKSLSLVIVKNVRD